MNDIPYEFGCVKVSLEAIKAPKAFQREWVLSRICADEKRPTRHEPSAWLHEKVKGIPQQDKRNTQVRAIFMFCTL